MPIPKKVFTFASITLNTHHMRSNLFFLLLLLAPCIAFSQNNTPVVTQKKLKVVFHLTTSDTLAHKSLMKQCHNFLTAAPKARIEVVCHNNGIALLQQSATKQAEQISALSAKGVDFVACENTMRERKIKREELVTTCRTVPAGVVEVVLKQEEGWSYIKAGF